MKTPNLLEVPKDSPTRKERIEAFKVANDIETHNSGNCAPWVWVACKMDAAKSIREPYRTSESNSMGAIFADVCRLLDEAGVIAEGRTEREAVLLLCKNLDILCDL